MTPLSVNGIRVTVNCTADELLDRLSGLCADEYRAAIRNAPQAATEPNANAREANAAGSVAASGARIVPVGRAETVPPSALPVCSVAR